MILELHIAHDLVVIDGIGRAAKDTHKRKPLHEFQEQHVYRKSTSCLLNLGLQLILASLRHLLDHAIHPCILHSKIRAFGKSCFHHAKDKKPLLWSIIGKAIAQGGFINTFKQHTDKHHDIPTRDKTSYWQESSILYILHNEKYAGDCLLQKTYTAQELPRFRKRNLGKYRQVFVKQSHPAIIEREKFERVQELLKRKRIAFAGDSVSTPFSKKIKCAECGSTFRLKKVRGKNYWTCMAHEKDVHKCSMLPLPEEQVLQAFLRLYYKLKYYGIGVLTQLISDFHAAKTGSLLWSENIVEINKQISDIASQERLLTQLKQQGSVDPDIFISRGNLLAERRRELKLQKERILRSEEDHTIQQTQDLLDVLESGPDWLDDFDEQLFSDLVEKIVVVDNEKLRFRLLNGLEVTEKIERTQR